MRARDATPVRSIGGWGRGWWGDRKARGWDSGGDRGGERGLAFRHFLDGVRSRLFLEFLQVVSADRSFVVAKDDSIVLLISLIDNLHNLYPIYLSIR